ncbi:hypothetical protein MycrhDRAFT_1213 [Mycolicibacterium rhodesiae JS60]|nr:hypothetical protein MycrhDRAFT_1213 [Mycolicibacterium rhodesiae JS60]
MLQEKPLCSLVLAAGYRPEIPGRLMADGHGQGGGSCGSEVAVGA